MVEDPNGPRAGKHAKWVDIGICYIGVRTYFSFDDRMSVQTATPAVGIGSGDREGSLRIVVWGRNNMCWDWFMRVPVLGYVIKSRGDTVGLGDGLGWSTAWFG